MQFPTPAIDSKQEQSLAWAQEANLSWAPGESKKRALTPDEISQHKRLTGFSVNSLSPGVYVVDLNQAEKSRLWLAEDFERALANQEFSLGSWAWDATSRSWRQLSSETPKSFESLNGSPARKDSSDSLNPSSSNAGKNRSKTSPQTSSNDVNTVNEINVFKDEKQHIFYSLKHLKMRIDQGTFSLADWGWDDDSDDWIPLSELLPKIASKFSENETISDSADNQKWLDRLEKLEAENIRLKSERDKLKSVANATTSATLEKQDLQTELEQLQRKLEDSQRREARARREFEQEMTRIKDTHQAEVESLQQKMYSLEKNGDDLRENLASSEKAALEKSDNLKASQMARKQQEARIEELDQEVEQLKKTVKTLQSDLNLEKKAHEERGESEARLTKKLDELKESLREHKQKVEALENEISDRNRDRELMAAELREQMDKIAIVSGNLDKVAQRLNR
ncbi:MAG: hypothetical protein AAF212_04350 [Verrucomicrobiota bacterium]